MSQFQDFIFEKLPTIVASGIGGGGLLILIRYFFPGFKENIHSQKDVLRYIDKIRKEQDEKIESQAKEIEKIKEAGLVKDQKIRELEIKYQLSQEQIELLKQFISSHPGGLVFLEKLEKNYKEKKIFLDKISKIDSGEKSLTKYNLTVNLLIVFLIFVVLLIGYIFTINKASETANLEIQKETLELKNSN